MLSVVMLSFVMLCRYAECRYAECHYAECHYAECHYVKCRYSDCRSAIPYCHNNNAIKGRFGVILRHTKVSQAAMLFAYIFPEN